MTKQELIQAAKEIKKKCGNAKGCGTCMFGVADGVLNRCGLTNKMFHPSLPFDWDIERLERVEDEKISL